MKTVTLQLDDAAWERAQRLAEARNIPLDDLIAAMIRMLGEPHLINDPVIGSMRDEAEAEEEALALIMEDRYGRTAASRSWGLPAGL